MALNITGEIGKKGMHVISVEDILVLEVSC